MVMYSICFNSILRSDRSVSGCGVCRLTFFPSNMSCTRTAVLNMSTICSHVLCGILACGWHRPGVVFTFGNSLCSSSDPAATLSCSRISDNRVTTASRMRFVVSAECACLTSLHCSGRWSLRWGFCDTEHDVTLATALSLNHWRGINMRSILILQLPPSVVSDFIRPSLSLWCHV